MAAKPRRRPSPRHLLLITVLLAIAAAAPGPIAAEGSATLYPASTSSSFRANLEWRTTFYGASNTLGFNILRRTLIKVYVEQGEHMLVGSSGVDVSGAPDEGDILILNPGQVTGPIGTETIAPLAGVADPPQPGAFANGLSCLAQRAVAGNESRGRIGSRAAELAGPNTENNLLPAGYRPCVYTAPVTGIYNVIFTGPYGFSSNEEPLVSGAISPSAADFGPSQGGSVTAWDVSVRKALNDPATESGRAFTYYFTGNTGGGGRNVISTAVIVTDFGFTYRVQYAADPFGFIVFANHFGYSDTDGSPLYHAIMADPSAPTQDQNELKLLQGGVQLFPPRYPIFFAAPYGPALDALGIPREPIIPTVADLAFAGTRSGNVSGVDEGGSFSFRTSQAGVYTVIISYDGLDFSPNNPRNRLLRGVAAAAGPITVRWNGRGNDGVPFPVGDYLARMQVQGGEVHFPFLDVENNINGGPIVELIDPPDANGDGVGDCPPWSGGCFGAFYDDDGYLTADGALVGSAVGGPLCPGGEGRPPVLLKSDPVLGYDTRTNQRAFGFPYDANPATVCSPDGGYGDKKGLDLWTFYPSNRLETPLRIVDAATAVTLRSFTATAGAAGVTLRWETGSELNSAGFHLLRAEGGGRASAVQVTPALIPARGSASAGAAYSWVDASARAGARYSYWLQELELDGRANEYGPAVVGPAPSAGPFSVWVPLLR
jgi:hypothetical protein